MITELKILKRTTAQIKKGSTEYYIEYKSVTADTTGLGGTWKGSGHLCDLHRCMNYWVGTTAFGFKPIFVFKTMEEVANYLEETHSTRLEM